MSRLDLGFGWIQTLAGHNQPKISLHFVWPDLIVTPREAKGIRSATIEFLRESCSDELSELLTRCYAKNELQMVEYFKIIPQRVSEFSVNTFEKD